VPLLERRPCRCSAFGHAEGVQGVRGAAVLPCPEQAVLGKAGAGGLGRSVSPVHGTRLANLNTVPGFHPGRIETSEQHTLKNSGQGIRQELLVLYPLVTCVTPSSD